MTRQDPATLGNSGYARNPNDHYVTPERTVRSLLKVLEDELISYPVWEPFCGDGAFSRLLEPDVQNIVSTDIEKYGDFEPDAILDFFTIKPNNVANKLIAEGADAGAIKTMQDVAAIKGFMPDIIISNPPYDEAERCVRHALALMEDVQGDVIMLLRNEWDSAKSRKDLFTHPTFLAKFVLLHRPRWIAGSTGAPRHNYSYFHWSWGKATAAPHVKPELIYAD